MNQHTTDLMILELLSMKKGWVSAKESYSNTKTLTRPGIEVHLFYGAKGPFWNRQDVPYLGYKVDGNCCDSTVKGNLPVTAEADFLARYFELAASRIAELSRNTEVAR